MLKHIEEKIHESAASLFTFAVVCIAMAVMVILNEYILRFLVGASFLLLAYMAIHLGWRMLSVRKAMIEHFSLFDMIKGKKTGRK